MGGSLQKGYAGVLGSWVSRVLLSYASTILYVDMEFTMYLKQSD